MKNININLILITLLIINHHVSAQVNIEQYRHFTVTGNLEEKFDKRLNIHTSLRRSSTSLYTLGFEYFSPFKVNKYSKGFFISKAKYGENDGDEFTNANFVHIRIITKKKYQLDHKCYSQ
jgi:hypothetical protein